jgi:hypothetical protein
MTNEIENDNNIKGQYPLGKGEGVSSILTGSTTNFRIMGTFPIPCSSGSAVSGRTIRKQDTSDMGKSADSVHDKFTASGALAMLRHNIAAMQNTRQSPSFPQVLVTFQQAADEIERLQARVAELEAALRQSEYERMLLRERLQEVDPALKERE